MTKRFHGWYSSDQHTQTRSFFYQLENSDQEVEITEVIAVGDEHVSTPPKGFTDWQYQGIVTRFIRQGSQCRNMEL